jgi:hypothetical protein
MKKEREREREREGILLNYLEINILTEHLYLINVERHSALSENFQ